MWSLVTPDPRSHVCSGIRSLVIGREGATKALAQVPPLESPCRDKDRKLSPSLPPLVVFVSLVPEYLGGMNPVPPHTHTHPLLRPSTPQVQTVSHPMALVSS